MRLLPLFVAMMLGSLAWAHPGGISPTDGCHNDNKVGERHWHWSESTIRGGPCIDGEQLIVIPSARTAPDCAFEVEEWSYINESLDYSWQETAEAAEVAIQCLTGESE